MSPPGDAGGDPLADPGDRAGTEAIVLGWDTATPDTVVALAVGERLSRARDAPPAGARPRHVECLLTLAIGLLDAAGLTLADVDRLAVGTGPGTFTGLRVGVAAARAVAQACAIPLVGVSSLAVLAAGVVQRRPDAADRPLLAVLDARRGEAFVAALPPGGALGAAAAVRPQALGALALAQGAGALAVGGGALLFREVLEASGAEVPPADAAEHRLEAGVLCQLAGAADPGDPGRVLPEYGRAPDAETTLRQ